MPYLKQEEICYQWLRMVPDLTVEDAVKWFRAFYGVTLTLSHYSHAKKRLLAVPSPPVDKKDRYIYALGTIHPDLSVDAVRTKTRMFFKKDSRPDLVLYWFQYAKRHPMDRKEAEELIALVEEKVRDKEEGFDLGKEDFGTSEAL